MQKLWNIDSQEKNFDFEIKDLVESEFLAKLLLKRGLDTRKKVEDFLFPLKMEISSPYAFCDMEKSVRRIKKAIDSKEKIIVWGDFDADGVTATALLYKTLTHLGADVDFYVPNRESENHGLNTKALVKLISKKKVKLVITVDCGIGNVDEINFLNSFKVDTIITDHHEAGKELPKAFAVINPKAIGALDETLDIDKIEYLNYLAGVGVAFKLACALLEFYEKTEFADEILPLVAVGTIADVVPLLGENRCFVKCGLFAIESGKNPGLKKLISSCNYDLTNGILSEYIAFGIAPRINAAGRLDTVESALKLLISENASEIDCCCEELNNLNKIRQDLCENTYEEAMQMLQNEPKDSSCVVLFKENWHIGIIGIVASKLVEKFAKPVFLMTKTDDSSIIRCSSRSIEGLNLYEVLVENAGVLEGFGGHSMAAGFSFDIDKTTFEKLKTALNETIKEKSEEIQNIASLDIDLELAPSDLTFELIDTVNQLQPFGEKNSNPLFSMKEMRLKNYKVIGANGSHLKLILQAGAKEFECVWWGKNKPPVEINEKIDAAFYAKINEFNSKKSIQLDIQDVHFKLPEKNEPEKIKIFDHTKKKNIFSQVADYVSNCGLSAAIFSENKNITQQLSGYHEFASKIFTRLNLKEADQIMFFDYPADKNLLKFILNGTKAKKIHLMYYEHDKLDADEFIKNISGMLKYVHNNKNGQIKIPQAASFLSVSEKSINLALALLAACKIIESVPEKRDEDTVNIKFIQAKELSVLKNTRQYEDLENELKSIREFRFNYLELELPVSF